MPKDIPPIGLAINPAANVNNESMSAVVAGTSPKKAVGKIRAAAAPYKKKSYHSMLVPARAVSATFLIFERRDYFLGFLRSSFYYKLMSGV